MNLALYFRCCGAVVAAAGGCPYSCSAASLLLLLPLLLPLIAVTAAAAVGCLAAPSAAGCITVAAPLRGLPLATPLLLLLLLLQNHGRTIVCSAFLPSPGLKLVITPLALANQQLYLLGRTCLTRPSQDSMAESWRLQ